MVRAVPTTQQAQPMQADVWVKASWDKFCQVVDSPALDKARSYFDLGYMRLEMSPVGSLHGRDNSIISKVISLFATLNEIPIVEFTNSSFRQSSRLECQPDASFYIGSDNSLPPQTHAPIDVDGFDPPTLVLEIASTTLSDDLGRKRLLYERLGVQEYWVVDAVEAEVIAFAVANGGSARIQESQVLSGLQISVVEEALRRGQSEDDGAINRWLLKLFASES